MNTFIPIYYQFLERHRLSKFTEEEIDNLNRTMSIKEIESIVKKPSQKEKHHSLVNSTKDLVKKS